MSDVAYRLAALSDSHLGYSAKCRTHARSGINERVRDGYLAFKESVTQIIDADVDGVLHGGDLMHRSWPAVMDLVWARQQLERFAEAGIPVWGNTGNHDASSERGKSPATAALNDPSRGIHMVTEPYRMVSPVDGLNIHLVSHYGLAQSERLLPDPVEGEVNILTAHGAAMVPGHEIFACADSPGEQPIGLDLLTNPGFAVHVLGHYHGMGEILDGVWYAGSSIRRGFSDPAGGRGWLLVNVHTDGTVTVEPQYISQRPQHDLPRIDAKGLTGEEVEELIRANLAAVDLGDAIVRQVVTNCSTSIRRSIDQPALKALTEDTLMWMPDFRRPEVTDDTGERTVEGVGASIRTAGASDLPTMYDSWMGGYATRVDLAEELVPKVLDEGTRHLKDAARTESGFDPGDEIAPTRPALSPGEFDTGMSLINDPATGTARPVSPEEWDEGEVEGFEDFFGVNAHRTDDEHAATRGLAQ